MAENIYKGNIMLSPEERVRKMTPSLLSWYQTHARILPWREEAAPYYVWISEIMLQQTRVEAVKPFFARFVHTLPDIRALAEVKEEVLLKLWEGLGYYNRARNLKKAAQIVAEQYGGLLPDDYEALLSLPGIGPYTAGAIISIAYGRPYPAVDGNVLRVMSRLTASREDIMKQYVRKAVEEVLLHAMPKGDASSFNQAMMEIGAMVCLPNGIAKCGECPLHNFCQAHIEGIEMELPVKAPKKARRVEEKTVFILHLQDKIAVRKRPAEGLLAGLYEFPNVEGTLSKEEAEKAAQDFGIQIKMIRKIEDAKHIFSHVEWHMTAYEIVCEKSAERKGRMTVSFVEMEKLKQEYAIPGAFAAYGKYAGLSGQSRM